MSTQGIYGTVLALAAVAALILIGVALHELSYAGSHPHAYGPAKVIAWGAGAAALLAIAVGLLAFAIGRDSR